MKNFQPEFDLGSVGIKSTLLISSSQLQVHGDQATILSTCLASLKISHIIPEAQGWVNKCKSVYVIHQVNKIKDKNHRILSIDEEKAYDKIQNPFMIKTLSKVDREVKCLNIIKAMYDKPSANMLNGEN